MKAIVLFLLAGLCPWLAAQESAGSPGEAGTQPPAISGEAFVRSAILPVPKPGEPTLRAYEKKGVDWKGLFLQSGLFLGIEHGFRLASEQGTRDGFRGQYLQGYADAVGSMHGWGDGDPFYVNYIGHPMQGAVTGFLWVQNDRDYRLAEFGRSSYYWKSRMRAAAFSWAYSEQFEIGPLSEASLGKVQRDYPQQGFVDHVVTPVIGIGWMIAEDAIDKYLLERVETKFRNPYLILLLRGTLNPTRSFANVLRFQVPWVRDTRPHVFSGRVQSFMEMKRSGQVVSARRPPPERIGPYGVAAIEVTPTFRPQLFLGSGVKTVCLGGGAEGAFRVTPSWQMVLDVNGCTLKGIEKQWSGDVLNYTAGPRWTPASTRRWSPHAQFLVGGITVTEEKKLPGYEDGAKLPGGITNEWIKAHRVERTSSNLAVSMGGGLDMRLNPAVALRIASLEYKRTWAPAMAGSHFDTGLSMTMGVVLRTGTW